MNYRTHNYNEKIYAPVWSAMDRVREHCPTVCIVLYTVTGKWMYMDVDGEPVSFPPDVPVDLLEALDAAAHFVDGEVYLPACFYDSDAASDHLS